jgi:hypothetical protein
MRGESGARTAGSGAVAAGWLVGACQALGCQLSVVSRRAGIQGGSEKECICCLIFRSSARTSCVSICEESLKASDVERSV